MIGQRTTATIKRLRNEADDLDGQFSLYDYCDNGTRQMWLDQAEEMREKANRLEARLRHRRRIARKGAKLCQLIATSKME